MRRLQKSEEEAKAFDKLVARKGFYLWEEFSGTEEYYRLREQLGITEQDCLSAYTEQPLNEQSWHIDHFRKRSLYPNLTFNYHNLFVDNRNDNYGACYKDSAKTGVTKVTFEGKNKIFNPAEEDLTEYITFNLKGEMMSRRGLSNTIRERVKETLRVFNLNHPLLVSKRSELITAVIHYKSGGLDNDSIRECLQSQGFVTVVNWAIDVF